MDIYQSMVNTNEPHDPPFDSWWRTLKLYENAINTNKNLKNIYRSVWLSYIKPKKYLKNVPEPLKIINVNTESVH